MPAVCVPLWWAVFSEKYFSDTGTCINRSLILKKYVWVKKLIGAYLYLHENLQLTYFLTFLTLRAYPSEQLVKKEGGILTFNDMFQTCWHLLCAIAQIASADAEIFQWAVFFLIHFVMFLHRLRQRSIAGQIVSAWWRKILQESCAIRSGLLCS